MSPDDSGRTVRHFDHELADLRELLLEMAARTEEMLRTSLKAVRERDPEAGDAAVEADHAIDSLEVEIENRAIQLLARRQPMATDLRRIVATIKISNDLERMGDHAVNIAQCARRLASGFPLPDLPELQRMADVASGMLRDAIEAFIEGDAGLARDICARDDEVDRFNDSIFRIMLTVMAENNASISAALQMLLVSRNLERIADLATNLGEDVIYIVEARSIKHHAEDAANEGEYDQ